MLMHNSGLKFWMLEALVRFCVLVCRTLVYVKHKSGVNSSLCIGDWLHMAADSAEIMSHSLGILSLEYEGPQGSL